MSINFDVNYEHIHNYSNFGEEFNSLNYDNSQETPNFFIDNDEYFEILQNNIKSKMEYPILSTSNIQKNIILNENIKDKEESKEKNINIEIHDINLEKTKISTLKKKDNALTIINKGEKNKKAYINNKIRKAKLFIIKVIIQYINYKISKLYNNKKNNAILSKIKIIDTSEIKCVKKDYNIELLNKTLKEILSTKISKKYNGPPSEINNTIIEKLLNEKDEEKRQIFNNIFNKTFREWIHNLVDPKDELKKIYEEMLLKQKDDGNEISTILENFEIIFENKKGRRPKKDIK